MWMHFLANNSLFSERLPPTARRVQMHYYYLWMYTPSSCSRLAEGSLCDILPSGCAVTVICARLYSILCLSPSETQLVVSQSACVIHVGGDRRGRSVLSPVSLPVSRRLFLRSRSFINSLIRTFSSVCMLVRNSHLSNIRYILMLGKLYRCGRNLLSRSSSLV